jgi:hypothetical protein
MAEIQCLELDGVHVFAMSGGKITQVMMGPDNVNNLFAIKPGVTSDVVKIVAEFSKIIDLEGTRTIRKLLRDKPLGEAVLPTPHVNRPIVEQPHTHKRTRLVETGTVVGTVNKIPITKERIIAFFKKYPRTYSADQMKSVWKAEYDSKGLTDYSIFNKQRAYQKFLESKGYIKQIAGHGNYGKKFEWRDAPFGATVPEKVDVDAQYLMKIQHDEAKAFRDR